MKQSKQLTLCIIVLLCQFGGVLGGCGNVSEDLSSLSESFSPPSPGEAARDMMDPHDAEKRRRGTVLISNAPFGGAEVHVRAYADKVEFEDNPSALAAAIRALGRHGQPEHAPLIATHLESESRQVRWEAAKALQRLHNPDVVPAMLDVLRKGESEDVDVRIATADALAQYPEDRVFQMLVSNNALNARDLALNHTARQSLQTVTGEQLGDRPSDWLAWYETVDNPFANQQDYLYPTYDRDESLLEKVTFWSEPTFEESQRPAGLRPSDTRTTYDDDEDSASNAEGDAVNGGSSLSRS